MTNSCWVAVARRSRSLEWVAQNFMNSPKRNCQTIEKPTDLQRKATVVPRRNRKTLRRNKMQHCILISAAPPPVQP
jgi:hypothetical protein